MSLVRKPSPPTTAETLARLQADLSAAQAAEAAIPLGPVEQAAQDIQDFKQSVADKLNAGNLAAGEKMVAKLRAKIGEKNAEAAIVVEHVAKALAAWRRLGEHNWAAYDLYIAGGGTNPGGKLFDADELRALLGAEFYRNDEGKISFPGAARTHMENTSDRKAQPPMLETLEKTGEWTIRQFEAVQRARPLVTVEELFPEDGPTPVEKIVDTEPKSANEIQAQINAARPAPVLIDNRKAGKNGE